MNLRIKQFYGITSGLQTDGPLGEHIHRIKSSSKLRYKKAMKDAFSEFEFSNNDEIDCHFLNKKTPEIFESVAP